VKKIYLACSFLISAACPASNAVQLNSVCHCRVTACQLFCHPRQKLRPSPPDRFRGGFLSTICDLHIISIITREILWACQKLSFLYLVDSNVLCVYRPVLTRRPIHSSSLQCTLSSSLKWSSRLSSANWEASSRFTLSSAACNSRRMLAESR
jgi:hypothetical protein